VGSVSQNAFLLQTRHGSHITEIAIIHRSTSLYCICCHPWSQVKFPSAVSERIHALAAQPYAAAEVQALGIVRSVQNADQVREIHSACAISVFLYRVRRLQPYLAPSILTRGCYTQRSDSFKLELNDAAFPNIPTAYAMRTNESNADSAYCICSDDSRHGIADGHCCSDNLTTNVPLAVPLHATDLYAEYPIR
jgi:hypothetical protein